MSAFDKCRYMLGVSHQKHGPLMFWCDESILEVLKKGSEYIRKELSDVSESELSWVLEDLKENRTLFLIRG